MTPRATYRLQFHAGFTFADAEQLVPYLADLGVTHLYASPIATARAGSMHGYDVVDPTTINPVLGGEAGFRRLVAALRDRGLGVLLDIVPNHVAVGGADNNWWLDVLETGPDSAFAPYFDIDWTSSDPALQGKVLAPFLGAPYADALAAGELVLQQDLETQAFSVIAHGAHRFPIRSADYPWVLREVGATDLWDVRPRLLGARFDGRTADGRERLHALLERQHYRLAWWRAAGDQINWRRFFDISELAGLRVEDEAVFEAVHALPLRLYAEGLIDGVRVDHIDGLADPAAYGRRLRRRMNQEGATRPAGSASEPWILVEKILAADETLARDWGVDGTSGYDFMNAVSAVLHDPAGAEPLGRLWAEISGRSADFGDEETLARREIVSRSFAAQRDAAALAFERLARSDLETRDWGRACFARVIDAMAEVFPNYRTYGVGDEAPASDIPVRAEVRRRALDLLSPGDAMALDFILSALAGRGGEVALRRDAVRRLQQLSAPVSAKAVEDTAFYRYGRLLSRNDVGFDPGRLGSTPGDFHAWVERQDGLRGPLLTTATHDHKRGEDARARLAVLSEIPEVWARTVSDWLTDLPPSLDRGDAYHLFQALVGAWPAALSADDAPGLTALAERISEWQTKALREAKLRSSWIAPDLAYEEAWREQVARMLQPGSRTEGISAFVADLAPAATARSLVQTGLKLTLPGTPDLYQGTEIFDFSLVDPDNRRPVDYAVLTNPEAALGPKAAVVRTLLQLRRRRPDLFAPGNYQAIPVTGPRADAVVAFRRRSSRGDLVVCAAVRGARACMAARLPAPGPEWWRDTILRMEDGSAIPAGEILGTEAFAWRLAGGE